MAGSLRFGDSKAVLAAVFGGARQTMDKVVVNCLLRAESDSHAALAHPMAAARLLFCDVLCCLPPWVAFATPN